FQGLSPQGPFEFFDPLLQPAHETLWHQLAGLLEPLVEAALPAIHLCRVHRIFPANLFQRHPGLPLLQHRQFLLAAPPPPSTTPILNRFHHGVHLALLAYATCPNIKWGTTFSSNCLSSSFKAR